MTDGPFKNRKLDSRWRRFAEASQNEAASPEECVAVASDALARHLVTREHVKALQEITEHLGQAQLELDPLVSIETILDRYEKTPFLDILQKQLLYQVAHDTARGDAIAPALDAAIDAQIGEIRNRLHEECIHAQEEGELTREAADRARGKIDTALDAVECQKVRDALLEGRKDAFEKDLSKSDSVDEGIVHL